MQGNHLTEAALAYMQVRNAPVLDHVVLAQKDGQSAFNDRLLSCTPFLVICVGVSTTWAVLVALLTF